MTLSQIRDAIKNNVGVGLKEVWNYPYSDEQLTDEIGLVSRKLIFDLSKSGKLNNDNFTQTISNIKLSSSSVPQDSFNDTSKYALTCEIPKPAATQNNSAISYIGPPDYSLNLKVYYSLAAARMHEYTRVIKNRPYAVIDSSVLPNGNVQVYIIGSGPVAFEYLTVKGVMDDPVQILENDGVFGEDEEFPVPLYVQDAIIDILSKRYILYYKQLGGPNEANDQTDKS